MIYNYLYDGSTGLPVEDYTNEEVKSLAEIIYLHVYEHYEIVPEESAAVD